MMRIVNAVDHEGGTGRAVEFIHSAWGGQNNYDFYRDAIEHSFSEGERLPRFFLLLDGGEPIGCSALLATDMISRQDIHPWFACLYVKAERRGEGLGGLLLEHGEREALTCGYDVLYLSTALEGFYEKHGWVRIEDGYDLAGKKTRIYMKRLAERPGSGE